MNVINLKIAELSKNGVLVQRPIYLDGTNETNKLIEELNNSKEFVRWLSIEEIDVKFNTEYPEIMKTITP